MVKARDLFRALFLVIKALASQYGVTLSTTHVNKATDAYGLGMRMAWVVLWHDVRRRIVLPSAPQAHKCQPDWGPV